MDLVITAVKSDLFTVLETGRYLLTALFLLAVFMDYLEILNTNVNWSDVIIRLVLGFVLFYYALKRLEASRMALVTSENVPFRLFRNRRDISFRYETNRSGYPSLSMSPQAADLQIALTPNSSPAASVTSVNDPLPLFR